MDNLFEQSKKFFVIFVSVFSFTGAVFAFVTTNSIFLTPCVRVMLPLPLFQILLCIGFVALGLFSMVNAGVVAREKNLKRIKSEKDTPKGFYDEKKFNIKLENALKTRKFAITFSKILGIVSITCFIAVFVSGEVLYFISEITKPEIDRVAADDNFRLIVDLITYFCFDLSVIGYVITTPDIVRNKSVNKIISMVFISFDIVAVIHFTYFFMGNFTNYPSFEDASVALIGLMFAIIGTLSVKTEVKKKLLMEWNGKFSVYE